MPARRSRRNGSHGPRAGAGASLVAGAQVQPLIAAYRSYYGLPEGLGVSAVAAGSLAEQAGVQPGDVLLALNGVPLVGEETLTRAMAVIAPGDVFELIFWRSGVYFTAEMAR